MTACKRTLAVVCCCIFSTHYFILVLFRSQAQVNGCRWRVQCFCTGCRTWSWKTRPFLADGVRMLHPYKSYHTITMYSDGLVYLAKTRLRNRLYVYKKITIWNFAPGRADRKLIRLILSSSFHKILCSLHHIIRIGVV